MDVHANKWECGQCLRYPWVYNYQHYICFYGDMETWVIPFQNSGLVTHNMKSLNEMNENFKSEIYLGRTN